MKKIVKLKPYECNDDIIARWALPIYLFSVLLMFVLLLSYKFTPGYHPTVFMLVMLRVIAPLLFAVLPFVIFFCEMAFILPAMIEWKVKTSETGQKIEQKKVGFIIYERLYLTDEQRQREIERHDREMREVYYDEKDPELLKQKENEANEFHSRLFKGMVFLLMPLTMTTLLLGTERVPWPGFVRIGSLVLAGLGGLVLLYGFGQFIFLYFNKDETFGYVSRRTACAKCFMLACTGVALLVLPVIIKYTGTDPNTLLP